MTSESRTPSAAAAEGEGSAQEQEEADAKARLRAAAPELCAVLKQILASNAFHDEREDTEKRVLADLDKCLKALAKTRR